MSAAIDRMQATAATTGAAITRQALPLEQQAMGLAQKAGNIEAQSSIVSASASVADKWMQASSKGLFSFG